MSFIPDKPVSQIARKLVESHIRRFFQEERRKWGDASSFLIPSENSRCGFKAQSCFDAMVQRNGCDSRQSGVAEGVISLVAYGWTITARINL